MTQSKRLRAVDSSADKADVDWQAALAQHDRWLRTIVYSRLRDREATEEVMQEVALAAVRQAAPLSDASKVAPWLYRLAVRQVLLYRRKLGRQRKLLDRYAVRIEPSEPGTVQHDPLEWLLADERRKMIHVAMKRLAERDAEILMLKYTESWSYHQIAAHLGVSHSAVEARLHRARQRLRSELAALRMIEAQP
jgi:RNA polymerase sigma-70 factor (ECF subfamily)